MSLFLSRTLRIEDDARLEPYLLLPSQVPRRRDLSPEERLWWAVLELSWRDLHGRGHPDDGRCHGKERKTRLALDAAEWFESPSENVKSFRWVCLMLGMEPQISRLVKQTSTVQSVTISIEQTTRKRILCITEA